MKGKEMNKQEQAMKKAEKIEPQITGWSACGSFYQDAMIAEYGKKNKGKRTGKIFMVSREGDIVNY